jgi:WD40 repeat protein
VDWNNDGLHDLLVGDADGKVLIFINTNNNSNPVLDSGSFIQAGGSDIDVGLRATPIVNDWDEDGRKDLLIGSLDGTIRIYLNEGSDAAPVFNSMFFLELGGSMFDIGSRSAPRVFDWNEDGLKDLLVGELYGYAYYLENVGTNDASVFDNAEILLLANGDPLRYVNSGSVPRSRVFAADWNEDGLNDIVLGGYDGKLQLFLSITPVEIDIKPWSDPNGINLKSKGVIPVAILTTDDFDATTVNPLSVEFGPGGATEAHGKEHIEDVDIDGDLDLLLHFRTQETGIECGDSEAVLTGETFDGQTIIEGVDYVNTITCD